MRKLFIHLGIACSVLGLFLMADTALATTHDPTALTGLTNPGNSTGGLWSFLGTKMGFVMASVVSSIAMSILGFFAFIMGMAGVLLNYSISFLVIGMGSLITDYGFGASIESMWRLMRDMVNLCFVFALIYIGITTILKSDSSGAKTALASIIISALLVNFSLYFSKAIIDVSNITADRIFRNMASNNTSSTIWDPKFGISAVFMHRLGVSTLFLGAPDNSQTGVLKTALESESTGVTFIIIYALGASILLFKLAFAFAFGAYILVVRFVMLLLLMIFSPVAFLPSALPKIGDLRKKWWTMMLTQAFVAPVYLFGIYLTLLILTSTPWSNGEEGLISLFTDGSTMAGMQFLLFYVIAIIMIIGTTMVSKSMSASGAQLTQAVFKNGVSRAVGSWAGRNTIGRASNQLGKLNQHLEGTRIGRNVKRLMTVGTFGALDERTRQALVKKGKAGKYGGDYSLDDDKKFNKDQKRIQNIEERKRNRKALIHASTPEGIAAAEAEGIVQTEEDQDQIKKAAMEAVQEMTSTELEEEGVDQLKKIAGLLSNKQMDQIKDSKDGFTEKEKTEIKGARKNMQKASFGTDDQGNLDGRNADKFLENMKPQDVAKLAPEILLHSKSLKYISGEVARKIHDNGDLEPAKALELARKMRDEGGNETGIAYMNHPRGQQFFGKVPAGQQAPAGPAQTPPAQTQPQQSAQTQPNESNFKRLERERLERDALKRRR